MESWDGIIVAASGVLGAVVGWLASLIHLRRIQLDLKRTRLEIERLKEQVRETTGSEESLTPGEIDRQITSFHRAVARLRFFPPVIPTLAVIAAAAVATGLLLHQIRESHEAEMALLRGDVQTFRSAAELSERKHRVAAAALVDEAKTSLGLSETVSAQEQELAEADRALIELNRVTRELAMWLGGGLVLLDEIAVDALRMIPAEETEETEVQSEWREGLTLLRNNLAQARQEILAALGDPSLAPVPLEFREELMRLVRGETEIPETSGTGPASVWWPR